MSEKVECNFELVFDKIFIKLSIYPSIEIMKKFFRLINILFMLITFTGCGIFLKYGEPKKEEFTSFNLKSTDYRNQIKTNGIYYHYESKSAYQFKSTPDYIEKSIIKFDSNGMVYFGIFGGSNDTTLSYAIETSHKALRDNNSMNYKGFYHFDKDTINIEILSGSPGHGYFFIFYKGIIKNEGLLINQTGYKPFGGAMKQFAEGWKQRMSLPPRIFKYKSF